MQTDLSFLTPGQPWPPAGEQQRFARYAICRQLYRGGGEHAQVYAEQMRRIQRIIGDWEDVISYGVETNYFGLISRKTADMLFGEPPTVTADADTGNLIDTIMRQSPVITSCYNAVVDISRYGTGLLQVVTDQQGRARIEAARADCYIRVVSADDTNWDQYRVLALEQMSDPSLTDPDRLRVAIHDMAGNVERRVYALNGGSIGALQWGEGPVPNGLNACALLPIDNVRTTDALYGADDYLAVESLVSEIEVRIAQIEKILDANAAPSMQGPESALIEDQETGAYKVKAGRYFVNQGDGDQSAGNVSYLTWDGNLGAAFEALKWLLNRLREISEMGAMISDLSDITGAIPSGSALRRMMLLPIAKVSRIRVNFEPALREAVRLAAKAEGKELGEISITWFDGLPDDPMETAQIASIRTGGQQTKSVMKAIMDADGLSEQDAEAEAERIREEAQARAEMQPDQPFEEPDDITDDDAV